MATIRWTGAAEAVKQVDTFTPANIEIGDIFTLTSTGLDGSVTVINFVATDTLVATVTAGLVSAWNGQVGPNTTQLALAADGTTEMTLTAVTAGIGFSVASTATDGGVADTQTLTRAATTANAGSHDWGDGENWSGGAVPGGAASQDVYLGKAVIYYNLDQSAIANTLDSLHTETAQLGVNPATGILPTYLQIKATQVIVGLNVGPSTPILQSPVQIDTGSTASTIVVHDSSTFNTTDSSKPSVLLKASSASSDIEVRKGNVGIAFYDGETTTVDSIALNYVSNAISDANVFIGEGVTLDNYTQKGGTCSLRSGITSSGVVDAGVLTTEGSGVIVSLTVSGGSAQLNSSGTITTLITTGSGVVDMTRSSSSRTVTTAKIGADGTFSYDPAVVVITNKIQPEDAVGNITLRAA